MEVPQARPEFLFFCFGCAVVPFFRCGFLYHLGIRLRFFGPVLLFCLEYICVCVCVCARVCVFVWDFLGFKGLFCASRVFRSLSGIE